MTNVEYPHLSASDAPATARSNGLAIAGLVCGIVGLFIANIILGPLAIVFGGIGLSRANRGAPHRGMSIAAIILGIVAIGVWVVVIVAVSRNGHPFYRY
jgi:hypothetical protein